MAAESNDGYYGTVGSRASDRSTRPQKIAHLAESAAPSDVRLVAILGGNRIPFAGSNGAYA